MVTVSEARKMEWELYSSISDGFLYGSCTPDKETPDDRAYYKAYAAVQELRMYLQEKEGKDHGI